MVKRKLSPKQALADYTISYDIQSYLIVSTNKQGEVSLDYDYSTVNQILSLVASLELVKHKLLDSIGSQ